MTWNNPQSDCLLCWMDEKTRWYHEDDDVVIADTLDGNPFVVWKGHHKRLTTDQHRRVEDIVESVFGEHDLTVKMNLVKDHWHAHISDPDEDPDAVAARLADE